MSTALTLRRLHPDDLLAVPLPLGVPTPTQVLRLHWRRQMAGEASLTAVNGAGRIVACAGLQRLRCGVLRAWAFFAVDAGPYLVSLWRLQRAALARHADCLALAWIDGQWRPSVRWARLLGFTSTDRQTQVGGRVLTLFGRPASSPPTKR